MLYDLRNFDKEPFSVFALNDDKYLQKISYPPRMPEFSKLEFSNDGRSILVGTNGGVHYILDAFAGEIKARLIDHVASNNSGPSSGDVCLSPDGRYVIGGLSQLAVLMEGSGDKKIAIWDIQQEGRNKSISPIHKLDAKAFGAPNVVAMNPRSALLATASTELVPSPTM
jgi:COMPASS component SWD2